MVGPKICVSIVETNVTKAIGAIGEATPLADLIEVRVDYLREPGLALLLKNRERPFIITNRKKEEGGKYRGGERERLRTLREAVALGAEYVDAEMRSERSLLHDLIANKKRTKVILSFHDFQETPSQKELRRLFDRMCRMGADVVKIVTFTRSWEDNLRILSLIPFAIERKQEIVTFCMGKEGKMSRIFAPLLGAVWTYASLNKTRAAAPGQLTAMEMRDLWERLK
jgi:3-dehydroquinate dehydratase type I